MVDCPSEEEQEAPGQGADSQYGCGLPFIERGRDWADFPSAPAAGHGRDMVGEPQGDVKREERCKS